MIYENLSVKQRNFLQARSQQKFAEIYKKTLVAYGLTAKQAPCSNGFQRCWNDLLQIWESRTNSMKYDLIYLALYHITWHTYPVAGLSAAQRDLLASVEQALIDEGYAYEVLSESYIFERAIDHVGRSACVNSPSCQCRSAWFGKYIYARTCCKVLLKNRRCFFDMSKLGWTGIGMFGTAYSAKNIMQVFEATIMSLVPSAVNWSCQEWTNEQYIMQEIRKIHGVDYTQDYAEFDALLDVFDRLFNGYNYDRRLLLLKHFPPSMAACLWPADTAEEVERFFIRICDKAKKNINENPNTRSAFRTDVVTKSWVYRQYDTNVWPATTQTKKHLLELLLVI